MSLNRARLEQKFHEEYNKLNEHQQKAVDSIEGPVMVIAGPGTGKTQILASRIGKILLDTDVSASNILCLTYTDAGVVAMRKRLLQFIGPDAYKVSIFTFHAFCNEVIQENLSLFERRELDPVSELERIQYLKELIDAFPKNHPLKRYRGDVYFEIDNLHSLFSTMKKEGWSPAFINSKIDEYISVMPENEEFFYKTNRAGQWKKGDKKPKYDEEIERMEKLRAAVNEYDNFQQLMRKRNRYDFDDMINWVISAFESNPNLLANYQERYQYILVDEYQDTSGTQNRIVALLISYWDKPNVFVVGDDDQSIYRFQGANVENMMTFQKSYKNDLLTVVLTNNYRSVQPILDISKTLISRNEERLIRKLDGLTKELVSSNDRIKHLLHEPAIREYETQRDEMIGIVRDVRQLILQGVSPGKIAVIYKENKYGSELSAFFKQLNIPVYSKRSLDILELPLVKKIVLLIKYLASEHDIPYSGDEMLFEILHFDWFGIPPLEIAKLTLEVADAKYGGNKTSIRKLLNEKINLPARDLFSVNIHPGLKMAGEIIEELIGLVPNSTLQQLFTALIQKAGVLKKIMESPDKHWQLQILTATFDFIKDETHRDKSLDLKRLVTLIELMEREEVRLPLTQVTGNEKGINLLTAHGSKGLEFEHVFIAGCNAAFWEKKRKPSGGFRFPDTVFASVSKQTEEEELRRLFYVALTRAEQYLYISYSKYKQDGKELEPSMFIAEILDQHQIPVQQVILDDEITDEFALLSFNDTASPEIERIEEEIISGLLDKFEMNVTALNNYLHCPLEFYFKNLIRIPSPKNQATEFGSAVHYALEKLFRRLSDGPVKTHDEQKAEFITDFEWYMHRHRESFTPEQFSRAMERGQIVLTDYYEVYKEKFHKIVSIERHIRNVIVEGVPLKGKLDKLEFDGKMVNVVDYKTGDPDKAMSKLKGPSEKDPNGGDYWRQAVFYKILVDNYDGKDWKAVSTEFDFVEPDRKKEYRKMKVFIKPEDLTTVTQQIRQTWEKIQNRDFYKGCGKEDCHWCNFVKTNQLHVALHDTVTEEE